MTRFVVDSSAALHLASADTEVPAKHKLLAPTLLRSQAILLGPGTAEEMRYVLL